MRPVRNVIGGLGNLMFKEAYLVGQVLDGNLPDKYLQNYKLWEHHSDYIKRMFGDDIIKSDYVSLHIRRGDYTDNPYYVDLTKTDYYDKAMAEFPNEKFLIFCADRQNKEQDVDDREWCIFWAKNKGINFMMRYHSGEVDDMNVMAGCKAQILANSSFSWWAGYLSAGKVIAPSVENWYTDGIERTKCPLEWVRI